MANIYNPSTGQQGYQIPGAPLPAGWQPLATPTNGNPAYTTPSNSQGTPYQAPTVNVSSTITSLRNQMANGSITPAQAAGMLYNEIASQSQTARGSEIQGATVDAARAQLFAPLTINASGKIGNLNSDGSISQQSTTVNKTVVDGTGPTSTSSFSTPASALGGIKSNYTGNSIVDYLSSMNQASDMGSRAQLAQQYGIQNYAGTADQNTQLLNALRGGTPASQGVGYATPAPGGATTPSLIPGTKLQSTGNPQLDSLLTGLNGYVQNNIALGNTVNPNLQITPELVSQFLQEAHSQVDPYYQQQLTNSITDINASLDKLSKGYGIEQAGDQATFQQGIANSREAAAGAGTAFSGGRGLNENNMLAAQNRTLGILDLNYANEIGKTLRSGASDVGTNAVGLGGSVNSFNLPTLTSQTASLEGPRGGVNTGNSLNFNYDPSQYKFGTIGSGYNASLLDTSNQFLSSYLKSAGNNSARSFVAGANGTPQLM